MAKTMTRRDSAAVRVLLTVLLLICSFAGFKLLDGGKAVLWLVFLGVAYPPALAASVTERWDAADVIEMYKIGVSQIPLFGSLLEKLFMTPDK
jgi:hypothetical protein